MRLGKTSARDRYAALSANGVRPVTVIACSVLSLAKLTLSLSLSPRVILVTHEGKLVGLVTVKDVLRHEATREHEHDAASPTAWEERQWEERVGLEGVLEEAWDWATSLFRFGRPRSPVSTPAVPVASDYELADRDSSFETRRGSALPR